MKEILSYILIIVAIIGVVFGISFGCFQMDYGNPQTIECTINDKWTKRVSSRGSDLYLISCDDEVYQISDLMFKGKFDSANIYAKLKKGKKYKLKTTGYRFGWFSSYQNINEYELIEE